jgi:hypothetical protein
MTIAYLSFRAPYGDHRECLIVIQPQKQAYRAVCVDAVTRLTIGCPSFQRRPDGRRPAIAVGDVMGSIGGYRLASAAVDIEATALADRTRRIANELLLGRRLSRRRKRTRSERMDRWSAALKSSASP